MAKRETIHADEIMGAIGGKLHPVACKACGGCGWFTSVGPDRPCECNPDRMSVATCFRRLEEAKREHNEKAYPSLFGPPALRRSKAP